MGGSEQVSPEELRALAARLDSTLAPLIERAEQHFDDAEINGPAFSLDGLELQLTYPGVQHLALRDLQTKARQIESIIERLRDTAEKWETAEAHSTVKTR